MSAQSQAQLDAALTSVAAVKYFGQEECIALLECLNEKVMSSYCKGGWSKTANDYIGDLLADMKFEQRQADMDIFEIPAMRGTLALLNALTIRSEL
jgi:hypothetical protein